MNIDVRGYTDMSGYQECGPMADKRNISCITIFGNKSTSILYSSAPTTVI